jgi:predicted porin
MACAVDITEKLIKEFYMQKKIIALAIASALTAPAVAMADSGNVSLYGQANLSIDVVNDGNNPSGSSNNLVSNTSRVGVKGSEDLGGGLTAVFQAEKEVLMDTGAAGSTTLFDRNTYLGVASADMGTVLFGRHDTPYKMSTRGLDMFADGVADNRKHIMSAHDTRLGNVIAYVSPAFSGFTVAAASQFGSEGAASGDKKGTVLSLAGMYSLGGIYATLAYQSVKAGDVVGSDLAAPLLGITAADGENKAFKLGGGYTMDAFTVNAVVEKTTLKATPAASDKTGTNVYLAGKFSLSTTDAVKLAYGKRGDTTTGGTTTTNNAKQVSLGYDHDMSKRTSVYALYTKVTDNTSGAVDPSTVSIGMKHAF